MITARRITLESLKLRIWIISAVTLLLFSLFSILSRISSAEPQKAQSVSELNSDLAYIENSHLNLQGSTVLLQKINSATDDLFVTPTITASFSVTDELNGIAGNEQSGGIRIQSASDVIDLAVIKSAQGCLYKILRNNAEVAQADFHATEHYELRIIVDGHILKADVMDNGNTFTSIAELAVLQDDVQIFLFVESSDNTQECHRRLDSIEIRSESIKSDGTAVAEWRLHTR